MAAGLGVRAGVLALGTLSSVVMDTCAGPSFGMSIVI
jgi:hypothetical protein